jgi:hypothetical protein
LGLSVRAFDPTIDQHARQPRKSMTGQETVNDITSDACMSLFSDYSLPLQAAPNADTSVDRARVATRPYHTGGVDLSVIQKGGEGIGEGEALLF